MKSFRKKHNQKTIPSYTYKPAIKIVKPTFSIDPDLRRRRLLTLIKVLRQEANRALDSPVPRDKKKDLTVKELREWADQCANLLKE